MLKNNLKQFRRNNNMSQEELASKVCVSRSSIALYEKGIRKPSLDTLKLICKALNINVKDLIDERTTKKSTINFFLCVIGMLLSFFIFIVLLYEFVFEQFFMDKLIYDGLTNINIYRLSYIFLLILGLLMYYLLFSNFKEKIQKIIILLITLPALILNLIFSINPNPNINISDNIYIFILFPSLVLLYIFLNYFIIKNLIFEGAYLKQHLNEKYINSFILIISVLFFLLIVSSIIYIYTAKVRIYVFETRFYEYDYSYEYSKNAEKITLLEVFHTKKTFSLIFLLFQFAISILSILSITIKKQRNKLLITIVNVVLVLVFITLWTMYPRIFAKIIEEIKYLPYNCSV